MRVHHLNCGTMRPPLAPALVAHVLLVETDRAGLVLVDTGYGLGDIADPARRLGPGRHLIRPVLDPAETALRQVEALGFTAEDVRHIVLTHFDSDHAGGLSDFPHAAVHVTTAEARAAHDRTTRKERARYAPAQVAHGPHLVEHSPLAGEAWRGFPAARELTEVAPGIVLVGLPGHSRGHAAVAVVRGCSGSPSMPSLTTGRWCGPTTSVWPSCGPPRIPTSCWSMPTIRCSWSGPSARRTESCPGR
jgi:glyoxylase-like metal-dependent hydrolase (beta-lactamase superfamily II)